MVEAEEGDPIEENESVISLMGNSHEIQISHGPSNGVSWVGLVGNDFFRETIHLCPDDWNSP